MGKINVAIIGVGNCASSLVQGVYYYKKAEPTQFVPGLMHVNLGGYHISDINFVAAIDIDKNKVGKDLARAIYTLPNNTHKFCDVPATGVKVQRGMTHDGLGKYLGDILYPYPLVEDILRINNYQWTPFTESMASGSPDIDFIRQLLLFNFLLKSRRNIYTAMGVTACSVAYGNNCLVRVSLCGY